MLCRAGIVAALYAVLTFALGNLSFGTLGFQIRPAEALTILPLFYAECVPALFVGCLIANLISPVGPWDIFGGSLISLIAALCTYFAGKLIEDTGLRGFRVGGAQVSEKHCGFVINRENATAADIVSLMEQVADRVEAKFGVRLEPEVRRIGEF